MAITCQDLIGLAEALSVEGSTEASVRASVSRSYYACFHTLLPIVEELPPSRTCRPNARHVTHEELTGRLAEWKCALDLKQVAQSFAKQVVVGRILRHRADYSLDEGVSRKDALLQIALAQRAQRFRDTVLQKKAGSAA